MSRSVLVIAMFLLLAGCSGSRSTAKTDAVPAATPQLIKELTDQKIIYTCPECAMEYDRAGKCSMCNADLVETRVAYLCPADGKPVEHAGKCPRCEVNAKVVKTAMAPGSPAGVTPPASSGAATGN